MCSAGAGRFRLGDVPVPCRRSRSRPTSCSFWWAFSVDFGRAKRKAPPPRSGCPCGRYWSSRARCGKETSTVLLFDAKFETWLRTHPDTAGGLAVLLVASGKGARTCLHSIILVVSMCYGCNQSLCYLLFVLCGEFLRRFGNHLDSSRIGDLPGLTDEVRSVIKPAAERGARVDEVGPR